MAQRKILFDELSGVFAERPAVVRSSRMIGERLAECGFSSWMVAQGMTKEAPQGLLIAGNWPRAWIERHRKGDISGAEDLLGSHGRRGVMRWGGETPRPIYIPSGLDYGIAIWVVTTSGLFGVAVAASEIEVEHSPEEITLFSSVATIVVRSLLAGVSEFVETHTNLTRQEVEVMRLVADGLTSEDIADRLDIAEGTVNSYIRDICSKMGVNSRVHAIAKGLRFGLIR